MKVTDSGAGVVDIFFIVLGFLLLLLLLLLLLCSFLEHLCEGYRRGKGNRPI